VALQHHLAIGLSNGRLPTPALLAIAESVGGVEWRGSRLDIDAEIARIYSELDPAEIAPADIAASLKRTGEWLHRESFAESWFENDAEVSAMIDEMSGQDDDAITGAVLSDLLEKRRGVWTERFLLMALWARAAKSKKRRTLLARLSDPCTRTVRRPAAGGRSNYGGDRSAHGVGGPVGNAVLIWRSGSRVALVTAE